MARLNASVRAGLRLALEHHPLCSEFAADRLSLGRVVLCSGCAAAAPGALAGLVAGVVVVLGGEPAFAVLAAGFALGLPQLTTYLHRGGRAWRFAAKALGGLGIGLVAGSALFLPAPRSWVLAGAAVLAVAFAGLQALRVRSILRTCDACPFRRDWDACPGFRPWQDVAPPAPSEPLVGVPASWGGQPCPKPLKGADNTPRRNAGPAHRG